MPRFVMLSNLGPNGAATIQENPERIRRVNDEVESMGVRVLDQYALLGPYDFLNILDAPDAATVARMATQLAARGTLKAVTFAAIPIEEYIASVRGDG